MYYHTYLRWLKNFLLVGLLLGLLGSFWLWLISPYTFPITTVRVEGYNRTSPETLKTAITTYTGGGFFNLDIQAIHSVVSKLPWVKSVKVQRLWPDILLIYLQEYQAIALWQPSVEHEMMAVDKEGLLFKPPIQLDNIPIFTGTTDKVSEILAYYFILKPWLETVNLYILEFGCSARQAWHITLNNKIKLLLGRDDPKLGVKRFLKVYKHLIPASFLNPASQQAGNVIYVDLRYTHGVALRQVQEEKYAKR